ncbi:mechanosensitive ion channel family protein [Lysobacter enzymogenes]|uniref:mechanosensitive ion channel family protein n=1 Tax=Lysobacter enzymogenes TaxID=69 RepID=UPI001A962BF5|nr:mechanosensitive ion channel domain-containing protein [Lysobacter enzymogenes]QQP96030.1 mechanosensitive ion channel [Lysobacter enzymogenes]
MSAATAPKPPLEHDPELAEVVSDAMDVVSNPTDLLVALLALSVAVAIGVLATRKLKQKLGHQRPVLSTLVEYLCTPALTLLVLGGLSLFGGSFDNPLIGLAGTLLLLFLVIRVFGAVVELLFRPTLPLKIMLRAVTVVAWLTLVVAVFVDRSQTLAKLYGASFEFGGVKISSQGLIGGLISGVVIAIVALWGDKSVTKLLRRSRTLQPNFILALSRIFSVAIWIAATLTIFAVSNINITALAAFGGALGIGLGLGLQKLAASYISGLIVLFEQSVRVGDNIVSNSVSGRVTRMTVRYTMIRTRDGVEAIVPNDLLTNNVIVNQSWSDRNLRLVCGVLVKGDADLSVARELFVAAMNAQPRVLQEPAPHMYITGVNDKGIQLDGHFWISDPENGQNNVASDIYDAVLGAFRKHGIQLVAQ